MQNSGVRCDESASRHASFHSCGCLNVRLTKTNSFSSFQNQLKTIFEYLSQMFSLSLVHLLSFRVFIMKLKAQLQTVKEKQINKHQNKTKQTKKKTENQNPFWVVLNSKNCLQLLVWTSSRPRGASHQINCERGIHRASTPGDFSGLSLKLPCQMVTPSPDYLGLGSSLHGLSLFKIVPISCVAFISDLNSHFVRLLGIFLRGGSDGF